MAEKPLRFLHASDLHLGRPLEGVAQVPAALRELFRDATYRALTRLVDHALAAQVDFVVLAGDVLDAESAGARGVATFIEQCERLRSSGIAVYWSAGESEVASPAVAEVRWPANVKTFWTPRPTDYVHVRGDGTPVAQLVGRSSSIDGWARAEEFWPHATGLPSIAVVNGRLDLATIGLRGIHYWALGGHDVATTLLETPATVHYPGTLQALHPEQLGVHGCSLVEWTIDRLPRITPLACDVARWCTIDVSLDAVTTREQLQRVAAERVAQITAIDPGVPLLATWRLHGDGALAAQLRRGRLAAEFIGWLRSEFGTRSPTVWSIAVDVDTPSQRQVDNSDETLLAQYLRTITAMPEHAEHRLIDLGGYLDASIADELRDVVRIADSDAQTRVLRQASLLGIDLLAGEEASV